MAAEQSRRASKEAAELQTHLRFDFHHVLIGDAEMLILHDHYQSRIVVPRFVAKFADFVFSVGECIRSVWWSKLLLLSVMLPLPSGTAFAQSNPSMPKMSLGRKKSGRRHQLRDALRGNSPSGSKPSFYGPIDYGKTKWKGV